METDHDALGMKAFAIIMTVVAVGGLFLLGGVVASIAVAISATGLVSTLGTAIIGITLSVVTAVISAFVTGEVVGRVVLSDEEQEYIREDYR